MKYNRLGNSPLVVSAVGLGAWALGGGSDWGTADAAEAERTVGAALNAGITFFDTAPIYGESENRLGRALKGRRTQVVLATKCGLVKNGSWTDHDLRPQTILSQLEQSLARLQTDYIDLYQVHYPDPKVPLEKVLEVLQRLQQQGKIRYIGLCNVMAEEVCAAAAHIISVQDELSLVRRQKAFSVQPVCEKLNLGFIGYGTLCGGILSGKYKKEPNLRRADARNYFYKCYRADAFRQVQRTVSRVCKMAQRLGRSPAETAGAWALAQRNVSCVLMGARTPQQVVQNAGSADIALTAADLHFLEEEQ